MEWEGDCPIADRDKEECPVCSRPAGRIFCSPQVGGFKTRKIPIFHGRQTDVVEVTSKREMVDAMRARGKVHMGYMYFDKEKEREGNV